MRAIMIIHVVQPGETIQSIANDYGKSVERLIQENEFVDPDSLIVGQTIVIVYPNQTYTIKEGDTLAGIADAFGVDQMQLLRNNPYLSDREFIYPGEIIVISYEEDKIMEISTNGYAYPFIDINTLKKTLPFLTYLTLFSYSISEDGELDDIDDTDVIQLAKEYGVAPIMLVSILTGNEVEDIEIMHTILGSDEIQNRLTVNILNMIEAKGYYGINMDIQYILPEDRQRYVDFMATLTKQLNEAGYIVNVTITPSTFELITGSIYESTNYAALGQATNYSVLLQYSWGRTYETFLVAIPFSMLRALIENAVTEIPAEKLFNGITSIGYIYQLPYIPCVSSVQTISHENAMQLAREVGARIQFNEFTQSSYFLFGDNNEFLVWFKDARSINETIKLVPEFNLQGIAIWNIMYYLAPMMLLINTQYDIKKVL
jgi:spore germination protein